MGYMKLRIDSGYFSSCGTVLITHRFLVDNIYVFYITHSIIVEP